MPELQFLSNGSYHVLITESGHAYSRFKDIAVTRWRADETLDDGGARCHVCDHTPGPKGAPSLLLEPSRPEGCGHDFLQGRSTFWHRGQGIETRTELAVSPDDPVELRRVVVTNLGNRRRTLSATSYAEIVLSPPATDSAHPAFSKLFVQTEIDPALQAIFATRRPSTPYDPTPWLFHLALIRGSDTGAMSFETDRMRFIGRGRDAADPRALGDGVALSGTAGPVLDAVAAIRVPFVLEPGVSITIDWLTGVASTRQACVALARKVRDAHVAEQILEQAGAYRLSVLGTFAASEVDALLYQRMAASLVYATSLLRADAGFIERNDRGQSDLWGFGLSGDLPIVLLHLYGPEPSAIIKQMVQAQGWWNAFGLRSELAVLCAPSPNGQPSVFDRVRREIVTGTGAARVGKPGGIFVLDGATLDQGARKLLSSVARIAINDTDTLDAQIAHRLGKSQSAPGDEPAPTPNPAMHEAMSREPAGDVPAANGLGDFSPDGREYVIKTYAAHMTPAPWVNVIANPDFGTLVSESGSSTTWSENAHEFRLTPWSNDPVSDPNTEAFYIRDEASGRFWSPTLLPTRTAGAYTTRHGFGYSVFEHTEDQIDSEMRMYVAIDSPIKFSVLSLHNRSARPRRLSVTGYVEWVLGDKRAKTQMQIVTEVDRATGALFARNAYNTDFAGRTAFFDVDGAAREVCGDRADFFGPGGTSAAPGALIAPAQVDLSGRVGAGLDPCAALRVGVDLAPGQTQVVVFRLGAGTTHDEARDLVRRWRRPEAPREALDAVHAFWRHTLGAVQVHTPDSALDVLANGWLLYQVIASRLWGRTAFYQSSGAFGFRDQLQDVMALVHAAPTLVREHLLRAASRQFIEGDVQHWWHPPSGKGVRTRCADDLLWLPLVICRYVEVTGDSDILDAPCPFLHSRPLKAGEASNYELPMVSEHVASLYEHGVRAIRHSQPVGAHGLPLMGGCDWNDGMNLVGAGGRGESVWMAFFLVTVLKRFAPLARARGDADFAAHCDDQATRLCACIEACAWDSAWYRRAWFDDGTVLGSAANRECRIDSIAQSWSVLSGAAPADRARRAMASLDEHLVHRDTRLVQLLDPPFDTSHPSPGYIQGYLPGVRENGGQYTHAGVWAAMAFAALGDAENAWELLALLNPVTHARDAAQVATYQVEPYVVAGDVYANAAHAGRGGWSWYTGSAGWMFQLIVESLLGLHRSRNQLRLRALLPKTWTTFEMNYRFGSSTYTITCRVAAPGANAGVLVDGVEAVGDTLTLVDDGLAHVALVTVGRPH
ncbi:MAG: GH36-type glycosyl hydrolase domain-containing protein [Pseudomonas sp.]